MMQSRGDRLRAAREVGGSALLLRRGDALGRYAVRSVSVAGVSLLGSRPVEAGRTVRVLLELGNGPGPVACRGAVTRVAWPARGEVGLELRFPHLPPETEDLLQDAVVRALGAARARLKRRAIVFDPRSDARAHLEGAVRLVGHRVVPASTALEALMAVRAEEGSPTALMVAEDGLDQRALQAVELLAHHPELRIIAVEGRGRRSLRGRLVALAHRVLPADFDELLLVAALAP